MKQLIYPGEKTGFSLSRFCCCLCLCIVLWPLIDCKIMVNAFFSPETQAPFVREKIDLITSIKECLTVFFLITGIFTITSWLDQFLLKLHGWSVFRYCTSLVLLLSAMWCLLWPCFIYAYRILFSCSIIFCLQWLDLELYLLI